MECCSPFHITWWPGNTSEVIDPNKAFDRHRRLNIFKQLLTSLAIITLIAGSTYLLVWLTSSGSDPNCQQNVTKNVGQNGSTEVGRTEEAMTEEGMTEEAMTEEGMTEEATTVPEALPDSSTAPLTGVTHEVDAGTNKSVGRKEILGEGLFQANSTRANGLHIQSRVTLDEKETVEEASDVPEDEKESLEEQTEKEGNGNDVKKSGQDLAEDANGDLDDEQFIIEDYDD